ncbi:MAG: 4-(cytidine 5'-diphospho)-2-C-methyl-D-erythritol kinase [Alphaproteobacteria bacterium]|nr:4-(cytidine 5'-diphospho)-2-C-methyl-D-erythritol kinase [Alphaproteobacteria bacterium]
MSVTRFAPAKVNLYLHVGPPLPDGRHPLDSLVVFAGDAGDVVTATSADALSLTIAGPFSAGLTVGDDNLVMRAARLLADHAGTAPRAALHLEKNLPIASGIGGGSTDAAAALHALNTLWNAQADVDDLARLSAQLGADLPACVYARTAMMRGTGEQTEPVAFPALHAVLANPGVEAATGAVYRTFDAMKLGAPFGTTGTPPGDAAAARAWLSRQRNDLEAPALQVAPLIGDVLSLLKARAPGALVRMSGSGATCFVLVNNAVAAAALASEVAAARPDWWVRATTLG